MFFVYLLNIYFKKFGLKKGDNFNYIFLKNRKSLMYQLFCEIL